MTTIDESKETLELLQLAEAGDTSAIDHLFDRHLPVVKSFVRRRIRPQARSRFDASDVIQEAHQSARRQFPNFLRRRPMPFRLLLIDVLIQPNQGMTIPDAFTDFVFGNFGEVTGLPDAVHEVSHTGAPQPMATTTWIGGNVLELSFR